jgi:transcriptional regulator with XRE-family HTH domain
MPAFDGRQIAAARALANISIKELAKAAGVTPRTIGRLEIAGTIDISPKLRHGHVSRATFDKIAAALAQRGIELVPEREGYGSGVRWIMPRAER